MFQKQKNDSFKHQTSIWSLKIPFQWAREPPSRWRRRGGLLLQPINAPSWEVKQGQISYPLTDQEVTLTINTKKHGSMSDFLNYNSCVCVCVEVGKMDFKEIKWNYMG